MIVVSITYQAHSTSLTRHLPDKPRRTLGSCMSTKLYTGTTIGNMCPWHLMISTESTNATAAESKADQTSAHVLRRSPYREISLHKYLTWVMSLHP